MTIFFCSIHELIAKLAIPPNSSEVLWGLMGESLRQAIVLAQQVSNPDIMGQIKNSWDNFVATGQIWALIIGMVLGYLFRGFRGG
ncbi:hypothetical protein [Laspinema olomoucense]|uniref:Uncharacterized protein n=1 Tax=Laspinema olomoucense D3b TaxID=2953688 RepID=A0ABT2NEB1_9CYAN|nr:MULTISPECIES: hypothetical protein [unclassified Laspinema]MCT7974477.1 hypothetical protein [Laspinema sp. D3d]MCT7979581.1 hypothetical protein [Laspinema sp. D3b]MCT7989601.1 hypothetical protein [Laspinema sp. D3a]MCT7997245.1 hypothetical protein [Laspinema sp. D3c]